MPMTLRPGTTATRAEIADIGAGDIIGEPDDTGGFDTGAGSNS